MNNINFLYKKNFTQRATWTLTRINSGKLKFPLSTFSSTWVVAGHLSSKERVLVNNTQNILTTPCLPFSALRRGYMYKRKNNKTIKNTKHYYTQPKFIYLLKELRLSDLNGNSIIIIGAPATFTLQVVPSKVHFNTFTLLISSQNT